MELNKIYNVDCLEGMKLLKNESIDLIITSPPYNIGNMHSNSLQFGSYAGNNMNERDYQRWQIDVLKECFRILKPTGSMFYNHKVRIKLGKAIHPLEWLLQTPFVIKQEITWDMGKSANCDKIRFFPFSERIYWLAKDAKVKLSNRLCLSDVWRLVPTHQRKNTGHIAVMPIEIVDNILSCVDGSVVLGPFAGTGTTLIAAKNALRDYIGFELNEQYYHTANTRIAKAL